MATLALVHRAADQSSVGSELCGTPIAEFINSTVPLVVALVMIVYRLVRGAEATSAVTGREPQRRTELSMAVLSANRSAGTARVRVTLRRAEQNTGPGRNPPGTLERESAS